MFVCLFVHNYWLLAVCMLLNVLLAVCLLLNVLTCIVCFNFQLLLLLLIFYIMYVCME